MALLQSQAWAHPAPGVTTSLESAVSNATPPDPAHLRTARAALEQRLAATPAIGAACPAWLEAHRLLGRTPSDIAACDTDDVLAVAAFVQTLQRHRPGEARVEQPGVCAFGADAARPTPADVVRGWVEGCASVVAPETIPGTRGVDAFPRASMKWMQHAVGSATQQDALGVSTTDLWLTGAAILQPWRSSQDRERLRDRVQHQPLDADGLLWMAELTWQRTRDWEQTAPWLEAASWAQPWRWDVDLRGYILAIRARNPGGMHRWTAQRGTWGEAGQALAALLAADATGDTRGVDERLDAEALRLGEPPLRWWVKLGRQAEASLRPVDAMRWYRTVLAHEPGHPEALAAVAMGMAREGQRPTERILEALAHAREAQPWDVRLTNLERWYRHRASAYETLVYDAHPGLRIEVPREEVAWWAESLPALVTELDAWFRERYGRGVVEEQGLTLAVMESATDFSVRLTGLPNAAPHAAAFGNVVLLRSPREDPYNWQLALVHELSHVVTLGQSRGRMPRWLSEGFAERDVAAWRPRWERPWRHRLSVALSDPGPTTLATIDRDLLRGTEREMLRAYDLATAWVHHVEEVYGSAGLARVLDAAQWGEPDTVWMPEALDSTAEELAIVFHRWLVRTIGAPWGPVDRALIRSPADTLALLSASEVSAEALAIAAHHALEAGAGPMSAALLGEAERLDAQAPVVRYVQAERARRDGEVERAARIVDDLLTEDVDDYRLLVLCARLHDRPDGDEARVQRCRAKAIARYPVDASLWQRDVPWSRADSAAVTALRQWWVHAPHDPRPVVALWLAGEQAAEGAMREVDPFRTYRPAPASRAPRTEVSDSR